MDGKESHRRGSSAIGTRRVWGGAVSDGPVQRKVGRVRPGPRLERVRAVRDALHDGGYDNGSALEVVIERLANELLPVSGTDGAP